MTALTVDTLLAYRRERYPAARFVAIAVVLAAASLAGAGVRWSAAGELAARAALAFALVFQLRLWDDLADRSRDRVTHPGRVLSRRTTSARPFVALLIALVAVNAALLAARGDVSRRLAAFALLCGGLALWYAARPARQAPSVAGSHLVLLKYPAIVYLLGAPLADGGVPQLAQLGAMLLVYLGACAYELLHDAGLRAAAGTAAVLAAELALAAVISAALVSAALPHVFIASGGSPP